ncbi:MAG TPA: hypothetical protein PKE62_14930 [Anaerolineales bacterium]|nr:hypothetical protein [Anaerolineales bacterium]
MTTFDLNILPIFRHNGQNFADLPGLFAPTPPRRVARGREKDSLILYLTFSGTAEYSLEEIDALHHKAATTFYQSPGTQTSAMRKAAESLNAAMLERNFSTTGQGKYANAVLVIAVVREEKCTLLLNGPVHVICVSAGQSRHIHEPSLSGKGLGSSQNIQTYLAQVDLHPNDLLVLCGKFLRDWEDDLLGERPITSLDAAYRKLTYAKGDLSAALVHAKTGSGVITVLRADVGTPPPSAIEPASAPIIDSRPQPSEPQEHEALDEETVDDLLIESSQSFQEDINNEQPAAINYQFPITDSQLKDLPRAETPPTITEEELDRLADFGAHMLQPSAYAIPPQPLDNLPPLPSPVTSDAPRGFPSSIPRRKLDEPVIEPEPAKAEPVKMVEPVDEEDDNVIEEQKEAIEQTSKPLFGGLFDRSSKAETNANAHAEATRQMAKVMVGGIQIARRANDGVKAFFLRFIPRLLPGGESADAPAGEAAQQHMSFVPQYIQIFIALIVPLLVGTMAVVVYLRFGQSVQYDEYYKQALNARAQAISETDPIRQRMAWENVAASIDKAESYRETDESNLLQAEAQNNLDTIMGVQRLEFVPAFTNGLTGITQISRMAASESDLYMLDAENGKILHATFTGRSLELDLTFKCEPGTYAGYQVGTLVDVLALPKVNLVNATALGIDANGNLLYCSPGQVPQAIPLPSLPNTNWGRITSIALDNGNLYVLDATSRSVWVFAGKDSTFTDTPYFYFGNQIPNTIDTAIDLAVSGDDLYLLHADGHISTCTFSRIAETQTKCIDPINFLDSYPAHQDINIFAQAHFTQLLLTSPPNIIMVLLDSENQKVFRFTPRSIELQNQLTGFAGDANPFQPGAVGAMAISPNYVLYFAIGNQVYFATNLP